MRTLGPTLLIVLVPLLAAALALGAYLNYASVRNTYLSMVESRQATTARRIAEDAEMALSMGLPLAGQEALVRSLVREREADPLIATVDVVSDAGVVLFSSEEGRGGVRPADEAALERREAPVVSPFGTVEGRVLVTADDAALGARLARLGRTIAWTAAAVFLAGTLAIALVVLLAVNLLGHRLLSRGRTAAGEMVPQDALPAIAAVDEAHRRLSARLPAAEA